MFSFRKNLFFWILFCSTGGFVELRSVFGGTQMTFGGTQGGFSGTHMFFCGTHGCFSGIRSN